MRAYHVRGHVLPAGDVRDVFIADGRFTFRQVASAETLFEEGWLVPGLVDAHAHLSMQSPAGEGATARERVEASARAHLTAGVLAIREPGSPERASRGVGPDVELPRTFTAGRFLASPDGYGAGLAREVDPGDLPAAVEEEAARGDRLVKLIGDFVHDGWLSPNWDRRTLGAAVDAAHAAGARITVHVLGRDALEDALEAGVDCVEHAHGLDEDLADAAAERGVTLVPTLASIPRVLRWLGDVLVPASAARYRESVERLGSALVRAARAGAPILAGTDAGLLPHGVVWREVVALTRFGLAAEEAVAAASWRARAHLGLAGIEEGAPADVVAFPGDPRADPEVLAGPRLVVLDGRVVRT